MRVLGVGIVTLDVINVVNHYPEEDEELRAVSQYIKRGGNTANSLSVLAQFGHECFWTGTLANDSSSHIILDDFLRTKINYSYANQLDHGKQPTSYITLNNQNGSRTIVHYRDLPELNFAHFKTIPLNDFDWIHFEARAIEQTEPMLRLVKTTYPHIKISIEVEKPREHLHNIFNLADLYLFSKSYANETGYVDAKTFLGQQKKFSPNADLICSWGKQGAYALLRDEEFLFSNAFPPVKLIDTIGAGDTFNAVLIHNRLASASWQDSLQFACEIAGKKCGQIGFENLA